MCKMVNQKNKIARDFVDIKNRDGPRPISFERSVTGLNCLLKQALTHLLFLNLPGPVILGKRLYEPRGSQILNYLPAFLGCSSEMTL